MELVVAFVSFQLPEVDCLYFSYGEAFVAENYEVRSKNGIARIQMKRGRGGGVWFISAVVTEYVEVEKRRQKG